MKVALFPSAFFPSLGGVEELTRQLAFEFKKKGVEPIIVTNQWPKSLKRYELVDGLPVYRIPMSYPFGNVKAYLRFYLTHKAVEQQLVELLRKENVDLIHVICASTNAHYAVQAKNALNVPLVITAEGELTMDAEHIFQRFEQIKQLLIRSIDEADFVTGCSSKTLKDVEAYIGKSLSGKSNFIFNGANVDEFKNVTGYKHTRPYMIALGRLVPQKGFDVLLNAYAQIDHKEHDVIIAGAGPEEAPLKQLAQQLGLTERVKFFGRANHDQVIQLLVGSQFAVVPSRADEGLPVVCVEAMSAGKAVIATMSGGAPEAVLNNENGLIVPREDTEALKNALTVFLNNPEMVQKFGVASRERAVQFSWNNIADQYLRVYETISTAKSAPQAVLSR